MSPWSQTTMLLLLLVWGRIQFEAPPTYLFPMHRVISAALFGTWTEFRHTESTEWCFVIVRSNGCQWRGWVRVCLLSDVIQVEMITSAVRNPVDTWCSAMNVHWLIHYMFNDDVYLITAKWETTGLWVVIREGWTWPLYAANRRGAVLNSTRRLDRLTIRPNAICQMQRVTCRWKYVYIEPSDQLKLSVTGKLRHLWVSNTHV